MTFQDLERAAWAAAKKAFANPKLRLKDLLEWSTSEEVVQGNLREGEVMVAIPDLGVWVAVAKTHDKRKPETPQG